MILQQHAYNLGGLLLLGPAESEVIDFIECIVSVGGERTTTWYLIEILIELSGGTAGAPLLISQHQAAHSQDRMVGVQSQGLLNKTLCSHSRCEGSGRLWRLGEVGPPTDF